MRGNTSNLENELSELGINVDEYNLLVGMYIAELEAEEDFEEELPHNEDENSGEYVLMQTVLYFDKLNDRRVAANLANKGHLIPIIQNDEKLGYMIEASIRALIEESLTDYE